MNEKLILSKSLFERFIQFWPRASWFKTLTEINDNQTGKIKSQREFEVERNGHKSLFVALDLNL